MIEMIRETIEANKHDLNTSAYILLAIFTLATFAYLYYRFIKFTKAISNPDLIKKYGIPAYSLSVGVIGWVFSKLAILSLQLFGAYGYIIIGAFFPPGIDKIIKIIEKIIKK